MFEKIKSNQKIVKYSSLIFLMIGFLFGWILKLPIIQLITTIIYAVFVLIFSNNAFLLAPMLLGGLFTIPGFFFFNTIPIAFIGEVVVFLVAILIFVIKNIKAKKVNFNFGVVGKSFLLLPLLLIVSTLINIVFYKTLFNILGILVAFIFLLLGIIYLVFHNFKDKEEDDYLLTFLYFINIIIVFEIIWTCFINKMNVHDASFLLGWSSNNNIFSLALEFFYPFILYAYYKYNKRYDLLALIIIDSILIFTSSSRAGMVVCSVLLICFIVNSLIAIIKGKKDKNNIIRFVVFSSIFLLGAIIFNKSIITSFNRLINEGISSSGRNELFEMALKYLKLNPLLGSGIQSLFKIQEDITILHEQVYQLGFSHTHNYIMDILATGGIVGFIFFLYHIFETVFSCFVLKGVKRYCFLLFVAIGLCHGLVDGTFFSIEYMIPFVIVFSSLDKNK